MTMSWQSSTLASSQTPPVPRTSVVRTKSQRSSVVPFTRSSGSGSFSLDQEYASVGSFKLSQSFEEGASRSTPGNGRRPSYEAYSSGRTEGRPSGDSFAVADRRPDYSIGGPVFVRRTEGFAASEAPPRPASGPQQSFRRASQGLLSRQLSKDLPRGGPVGYDDARTDILKEKLEKCFEKSADPLSHTTGDVQPVPDGLLPDLQAQHAVFSSSAVTKAFIIASHAHDGQYRRNGDPLLLHCVESARILAELGMDETTVAAGLLHDVLDDSMMTEQQLRNAGAKVAGWGEVVDMVLAVSKMSEICQLNRDSLAARDAGLPASQPSSAPDAALSERLAAMLLAMADVRCVLVKLADRLHNMRTLAALPPAKQRTVAAETLAVFAPLANRLGVWGLKAELEDLAFGALHPEEARELATNLCDNQHRFALEKCLNELKAVLEQRGVEYKDLSGRFKNQYGVWRKMTAKGLSLAEVLDLRALRVIVKNKEECYQVLAIIHKLWRPQAGRFKDYIRHPKPNGYQSLHTVVEGADGAPVEIQIRTDKMHYIAEYGVAAHWRYKEKVLASAFVNQMVAWARFILSWKLELTDKKSRPAGSPPRDNSLAALLPHFSPPAGSELAATAAAAAAVAGGAAVAVGAHAGQAAAAAAGGAAVAAVGMCAFPEHAHNCRFAQFVQRHQMAPQPVTQEMHDGSPVYVIVFDNTSRAGAPHEQFAIEELPPRCTVGQLAARAGLLLGARLLVNHEPASSQQVLCHGDKVEYFDAECAPATAPASPDASTIEAERERLARLFRRSGDLADFGIISGQPVPT